MKLDLYCGLKNTAHITENKFKPNKNNSGTILVYFSVYRGALEPSTITWPVMKFGKNNYSGVVNCVVHVFLETFSFTFFLIRAF